MPANTTTARNRSEFPIDECQREEPIRLASVAIRRGRLACEVVITDERNRYCTPALASYVGLCYPDIARHACVNGEGRQFGAVMQSTSVAHMLEHIAIDEQVGGSRSDDALFVGTTEWIDEKAGRALVQLSFCDDLSALEAFNKALRFLNNTMLTYQL